jgi:hypothetical protein
MTTAAIDPATCTQCGTTAPLRTMLMNEMGALTCNSCMAKRGEQDALRKRAKNTMLAPAMVSALAYMSFLVPMLNIAAPGVLAAIAIWGAIGGIKVYNEIGRHRDDHGVSDGLRTGLLVMSILTIIFASIPLLLQIVAWIGMAFVPVHPRPATW